MNMPTDAELIQAFSTEFIDLAGKKNSDKVYSVIFADGRVSYLRAPNSNRANKLANEYAGRILGDTTVLFVTLDHRGEFIKK